MKFLKEFSLFVAIAMISLVMYFEHTLLQSNVYSVEIIIVLLGGIVYSASSVAHKAEDLAKIFGEPWGSLILVMAIVVVEVVIIVILLLSAL